jgi:1,4-dihydroxy-2-naphthoyl-CoA hydrolase
MTELERLQQMRLPFSDLIGVRFISASRDKVTAELDIREELCTHPSVIHGGAIMGFADTVGAAATILNLPDGAWTTTIESKTNFVSSAPAGGKLTAEATPVHRGRQTMVWQTRIVRQDGRLVALVTQTQLVLEARTKA